MRKDAQLCDVLNMAKSTAVDLQPWPGYFDTKAREFETIFGFCGFGEVKKALEIGCGNGFTSALLGLKADRVEAMDLAGSDPKSHSLGIRCAEELIGRLKVANVNVSAGTAEKLPFPDKSFDLVFSEYVVQYIANKDRALSELRRVLSDNGRIITIVPNFMERILVPIIKYEYVVKRLLTRLARCRATSRKEDSGGIVNAGPSDVRPATMLKAAGDYLFLRTDGVYKSYIDEMLKHRPASWRRLFEGHGFRIKNTFTTQIIPLGLFELMGAPAVRLIARGSHRLNSSLGNKPFVRSMGYSLGIVAVKG